MCTESRGQGNLVFQVTKYLPDGSSSTETLGSAITLRGDLQISTVGFGAMGGNFVKLYVGALQLYRSGVIWEETFESGTLNGFTAYYTEPSYVHADDALVYDNGPHWMLLQLKT